MEAVMDKRGWVGGDSDEYRLWRVGGGRNGD